MEDQVVNAADTPEVATPEQQETQSPPQAVQEPEDANTRNWRELRKTVAELKRENQYLRHKVEQPPAPVQEPEAEPPAADDDIVTNKVLKRKVQELEGLIKKKDAETVEERLLTKFNDFHDVVSEENVNLLKQNDPELAASIAALQHDPFKQGTAAYKILKKMDYTQQRQIMHDKAKSDENAKKPVSANAVKPSPLSQANRFANGLTQDLKKALWKEMQEARKGA